MGPLNGIKVVEMAGLAPGPFAAMMLADMGAQVLRVERPGQKAPPGHPKVALLERGRRAIALDLKSPAGTSALRKLLAGADAFIEGFRPGVMERLGFGPEPCLELNPRLVYGRMTGWGQDGPLAKVAGHDINYIALTGALHSIGRPGGPPSVPLNLVGDFGGGGLYLAFGIVCALLEAGGSGRGQVVDAAMIDGAASLMTYLQRSPRATGATRAARTSWTARRRRGTASTKPPTSDMSAPPPRSRRSTPSCCGAPGSPRRRRIRTTAAVGRRCGRGWLRYSAPRLATSGARSWKAATSASPRC